jgi:WD40 repeat protein
MVEADPHLCYGIMAPGQYPLESLAVAMLKACGKAFDGHDLASRAAGYRDNHRLLTQDAISALATGNGHSGFVLLIDQFEQLFASGVAQVDREAVIENIRVMTADDNVQACGLVTIRDDFIGECARNPTLAQLLERQILITPLNKDELREAIEKPARAAGAKVEPELTRTLIRDCEGEANALPLLEFVLYKLWESAGSTRVLSYQRYEQLGGLIGALNSHADSIYGGLNTKALQDAARRIFLALIQPFQNARFARQSRFVDELLPSTGDAEAVRTTERALGVLAGERARLVTIRGLPGPKGETLRLVELSHEILIQCWDRLRSWLNADREFLLWKERLRVSVNDWRAHPNDAGVYLQGMLLDQAVNWLKQRPDEHSSEERQYIDSCRAKRDAARRRRFATIAAQAAGVLTLIAIIIWLPSRYSKQRLLANIRATIASDSDASIVLALHALNKYPGYETEALLQEAVQTRSAPVQIGFPGAIEEMTFLPDSRRVAVLMPGLAPRVCPSGSKGSCVSYGADKALSRVTGSNTQLFAGTNDGSLHIWALDSREARPGPPPVPGRITAIAVPETGGNILYASTGDGNIIYRWGPGMQAPSLVATLPEKINDIAQPEKGERLAAVGNDGGVFLFNSLTEPPKHLKNPSGIAGHIVMTADGQKLTTIPQVGSLYAWQFSAETGSPVGPLSGSAQGGGMSRDGSRLFVVNRDNKGRLSISIRDGVRLAELCTFALAPEQVTSAVMSPDGKRIATAVTLPGNEGAIRVYELDPAELAMVAKEVIANKDQASLLAACRQHLDAGTCAKYIGVTK